MLGVSENSGWEKVGLGVSSDEQVCIAAVPSCNIGSQETSGEVRTVVGGHDQWWFKLS